MGTIAWEFHPETLVPLFDIRAGASCHLYWTPKLSSTVPRVQRVFAGGVNAAASFHLPALPISLRSLGRLRMPPLNNLCAFEVGHSRPFSEPL